MRRPAQTLPIVTTAVKQPRDWLGARQRAQIIATALEFPPHDRTRIATAVSEIVRNALEYAGGGKIEFLADTATPQSLRIRISDQGPGIAQIEEILAGRYRSSHGLGIGITGSRALMDEFTVDTSTEGTIVEFRKFLPRAAPLVTPLVVQQVVEQLANRRADPLEEAQAFNHDLLRTLDELNRVNGELEAANRSKDLFLATVSHELRNPMTAILGWIQMLSLSTISPEMRADGLKAIETSARMQARLVDDMLDAARAETGKLQLDPVDLDLRQLVAATALAAQPGAVAKPVSLIDASTATVLPVRGDPARLQQIVWNLLTNAIKFTPTNGSITVAASARGTQALVAVTDTGTGITPALLPHVFERFRQGSNAEQTGGLGLGLTIARHLAELHSGSIEASSDGAGCGSCFTLILPLRS